MDQFGFSDDEAYAERERCFNNDATRLFKKGGPEVFVWNAAVPGHSKSVKDPERFTAWYDGIVNRAESVVPNWRFFISGPELQSLRNPGWHRNELDGLNFGTKALMESLDFSWLDLKAQNSALPLDVGYMGSDGYHPTMFSKVMSAQAVFNAICNNPVGEADKIYNKEKPKDTPFTTFADNSWPEKRAAMEVSETRVDNVELRYHQASWTGTMGPEYQPYNVVEVGSDEIDIFS
jgi:hypothetical protein